MPHSKFRAFIFFIIAWERGRALGSGEQGTWERIDSFLKPSKDLLHYSMLFLEMCQVFLTSIVDAEFLHICFSEILAIQSFSQLQNFCISVSVKFRLFSHLDA